MEYHWQTALDESLRRNRRDAHHRYLQLATIGLDGFPANRTLVFRGFGENGELHVVTDARSDKLAQVKDDPRAEICWYFTRSREQYRLRGMLELVGEQSEEGAQAARRAAWFRLSDAAREQFFWPHPGTPLDTAEPLSEGREPPAHFLLGAFSIQRVDHLQLAGTPQQRTISHKEDDVWISTAVNP